MFKKIHLTLNIIQSIFLFILFILVLLQFLSRVVPSINFQENIDLIKDLIVVFTSLFIVITIFETFILDFNLYRIWKSTEKKNIKWVIGILVWKIVFICLFSIILYFINKPYQLNNEIYYYNDISLLFIFIFFIFIILISIILLCSLKYFRTILDFKDCEIK